ncbi:MAG TPA: hypothetical protein VIQ05_12660 [Tardiphaga sp.]
MSNLRSSRGSDPSPESRTGAVDVKIEYMFTLIDACDSRIADSAPHSDKHDLAQTDMSDSAGALQAIRKPMPEGRPPGGNDMI